MFSCEKSGNVTNGFSSAEVGGTSTSASRVEGKRPTVLFSDGMAAKGKERNEADVGGDDPCFQDKWSGSMKLRMRREVGLGFSDIT